MLFVSSMHFISIMKMWQDSGGNPDWAAVMFLLGKCGLAAILIAICCCVDGTLLSNLWRERIGQFFVFLQKASCFMMILPETLHPATSPEAVKIQFLIWFTGGCMNCCDWRLFQIQFFGTSLTTGLLHYVFPEFYHLRADHGAEISIFCALVCVAAGVTVCYINVARRQEWATASSRRREGAEGPNGSGSKGASNRNKGLRHRGGAKEQNSSLTRLSSLTSVVEEDVEEDADEDAEDEMEYLNGSEMLEESQESGSSEELFAVLHANSSGNAYSSNFSGIDEGTNAPASPSHSARD